MRDDLTIDRSLDLDVDPDEAASLATTPDGWCRWMVDEAEVVAGPDGVERGTVVDDGVRRSVRIDERTGRSVRFTWWEVADPGGASEVVIRVHPAGTGSRVEIGERRLTAAARASGSASDGVVRWQVRGCLLGLACTSPARTSLVRA